MCQRLHAAGSSDLPVELLPYLGGDGEIVLQQRFLRPATLLVLLGGRIDRVYENIGVNESNHGRTRLRERDCRTLGIRPVSRGYL